MMYINNNCLCLSAYQSYNKVRRDAMKQLLIFVKTIIIV